MSVNAFIAGYTRLLSPIHGSDAEDKLYDEQSQQEDQSSWPVHAVEVDHIRLRQLNGGEDYELLFTVPLALQERVMRMGGVDVIGHITAENTGAYLVTPDGGEIRLKAQGFRDKE